MERLIHTIKYQDVRCGDHVYCWRGVVGLYAHHGIVVDTPRITDDDATEITPLQVEIVEFAPPRTGSESNQNHELFQDPSTVGIYKTTLDKFTKNQVDTLKIVLYGCSEQELALKRAGTVHELESDPSGIVVERATAVLRGEVPWEPYHLLNNNCEHFAVWCKTGTLLSAQVSSNLVSNLVHKPAAVVKSIAAAGGFVGSLVGVVVQQLHNNRKRQQITDQNHEVIQISDEEEEEHQGCVHNDVKELLLVVPKSNFGKSEPLLLRPILDDGSTTVTVEDIQFFLDGHVPKQPTKTSATTTTTTHHLSDVSCYTPHYTHDDEMEEITTTTTTEEQVCDKHHKKHKTKHSNHKSRHRDKRQDNSQDHRGCSSSLPLSMDGNTVVYKNTQCCRTSNIEQNNNTPPTNQLLHTTNNHKHSLHAADLHTRPISAPSAHVPPDPYYYPTNSRTGYTHSHSIPSHTPSSTPSFPHSNSPYSHSRSPNNGNSQNWESHPSHSYPLRPSTRSQTGHCTDSCHPGFVHTSNNTPDRNSPRPHNPHKLSASNSHFVQVDHQCSTGNNGIPITKHVHMRSPPQHHIKRNKTQKYGNTAPTNWKKGWRSSEAGVEWEDVQDHPEWPVPDQWKAEWREAQHQGIF